MIQFSISTLPTALNEALIHKINQKTKPLGSLGMLEHLAYQIGRIQNTLNPELRNPTIIVVGADHGICEEGVSPCPTEITWQQMINFSNNGGGIGLFAKLYGLNLIVVDAGVNYDFNKNENIINKKVLKGTRNFHKEPALSIDECHKAMENGADLVMKEFENGCNVIGFGEMGIGNTSPASVLMSLFCNIPIEDCVGPGSGLNQTEVIKKKRILKEAIQNHPSKTTPIEILATFGGLEIATITGGMLKAAELGMLILNDGFIITSALLAAHAINPKVLDYTVFSHQSNEGGHKQMIEFLKGKPVMQLDLRLGEGTGAAIAYPIIEGAVRMLNDMTSFEEAKITDTTSKGITIL